MDKSMWQTFGAFDLLLQHICIQAILLWWKYITTMQIRDISRLWFCRRPWRLKVDFRWNVVHFRKPNICANKLDVQETNCSFTLFIRGWDNFSCRGPSDGWDSRSRSLEICFSKCSIIPHQTKPTKPKMWERNGETCRQTLIQTCGNKFQPCTLISIWPTLITFHQAWHIVVPMLCCMSLRIMKLWLIT